MIRIFLMLAASLASSVSRAEAMDYDLGPIHITQPWAPATPKGASVGAGYMKITNNGTAPDRLSCAASFASRCEIHVMKMDNGVMQMRPLPDGIEIKPGDTIDLNPDSYHVMFQGLKQPLQKGQSLKVTLKLEKAGTIDVEYEVGAIGAKSPMPAIGGEPGMPGMPGMPKH